MGKQIQPGAVTLFLLVLLIVLDGANAPVRAESHEEKLKTIGYEIAHKGKNWTLWTKSSNAFCDIIYKPVRLSDPDAAVEIVMTQSGAAFDSDFELRIVTAGEAKDYSVLSENYRQDLEERSSLPGDVFWNAPLQKVIDNGNDFYLTWYNKDKKFYQSAFFSPGSFKEAVNKLGEICRAHVDAYLGSPTPGEIEERNQTFSSDEKRQIQFALLGKSGHSGSEYPKLEWPPSDDMRDQLLSFSNENKLYVSRFISRDVFRALSKVKYETAGGKRNYSEKTDFKRHRDWMTFTEETLLGKKRCVMVTRTKRVVGPKLWVRPDFSITADEEDEGSSVTISFAEPNPFTTSFKIMGEIKGKWFELRTTREQIRPDANQYIMPAIKGGRSMMILGREKGTLIPIEVEYSAVGYTAAFNELARKCKRPKLRDWVR